MWENFQTILKSYDAALAAYQRGQLSRNYLFELGKPSQLLLHHGVEDLPIMMFQRTVGKTIDKHGLLLLEILHLPLAIRIPEAIFLSKSSTESRVLLLRTQQSHLPLAVVLTKTQYNKEAVNELKTIYPKERSAIAQWQEDKLLLWPINQDIDSRP